MYPKLCRRQKKHSVDFKTHNLQPDTMLVSFENVAETVGTAGVFWATCAGGGV